MDDINVAYVINGNVVTKEEAIEVYEKNLEIFNEEDGDTSKLTKIEVIPFYFKTIFK